MVIEHARNSRMRYPCGACGDLIDVIDRRASIPFLGVDLEPDGSIHACGRTPECVDRIRAMVVEHALKHGASAPLPIVRVVLGYSTELPYFLASEYLVVADAFRERVTVPGHTDRLALREILAGIHSSALARVAWEESR